jgi:hypothetical protein
MTVRAALQIALTVTLVASLTGCLFSPREPDGPPGEGDEIPWVTPTDTDKVLQNLSAALAGEGTQNYLDCFTSDAEGDFVFRCFFDPSDSLDAEPEAEERYGNWRIADEQSAVDGIFLEAAKGISVSFTTNTEPDESFDVTYRREDYVLTIVWQSGPHDILNEEVEYRGRATLWMRKDGTGRWAIFRWVDRRLPDQGDDKTWGKLRGDYRAVSR